MQFTARKSRSKQLGFSLFLFSVFLFIGTGAHAQEDEFPLEVFTGEIANIAGPGDIVSLRQPENIIYAVNVWGEELTREVNGVTFWSDKEDVNPDLEGIVGYRTDWTHTVTNWESKPEFGDSASDDELEEIMSDIRWTNNSANPSDDDPGVGSHFAVEPNEAYFLELLISGNHNENRIWDIWVDGNKVVSEFDSTNYEEYDPGIVYAYRGIFFADDNELNVTFNQERRAGIDGNAILQAVIVSTPGDITLGDFNEDGVIDTADFQILSSNFQEQDASFADGDINFDSVVDLSDFLSFRLIFEQQRAGAAAVPEPGALPSLLLGSAVFLVLRRRRPKQVILRHAES